MAELEILYFGNDWSGENRTSSHHVAERLGSRFPLLYIETPGIRAPEASGRDFRKLWKKLTSALQPPRQIGPHMWLMTMPQVPFRKLPGVAWLNRVAGKVMVRRAVRKLGFQRPIYWFLVPHAASILSKSGKEFVVYYCIDDYASFPGMDAAAIQEMDDQLTRRANQVFVSSARLLEDKKSLNSECVLSPHGVDVELFGRTQSPATQVPPEAAQLRHPVIGYFGVLGAWTDVALLDYIASQRPDWRLLLIGRVTTDISSLRAGPNVVLVPPKPYRELPGWVKAFDVAVIPYLPTRQVYYASPLKLREYLASGKPVISVWTPEVERFEGHVRIARTHPEFVEHIELAMREESDAARSGRLASVANGTWEKRAEDVVRAVLQKRRSQEAGSHKIGLTKIGSDQMGSKKIGVSE